MVKSVPMRMCIVCKTMVPKRELIRIIRTKDGVYSLDFTGKANGRGAYICDNTDCIKRCVKTKALNRAFKENVPEDVYEKILGEYAEHKN